MILVTGGTGLVGSYLLHLLTSKGIKVKASYRNSSNLTQIKTLFKNLGEKDNTLFDSIEWVLMDLNDVTSIENAVKGIDTLYHCAAMVSFNPKDRKEMERVNVVGTQNLINACLESDVKKVCYVSSIAVLEKIAENKKIKEDDISDYKSLSHAYAQTKHAAEMEVWRGSQEGLEVVVVRPGVILGAGFWQSGTGQLFGRIHKGLLFYTEGVTGYVSVEEVVNAMFMLVKNNCFGKAYTLVAENVSFKNLFYEIAEALNVKSPKYRARKWMTTIFWRLEKLKMMLLGKAPKLTKHLAKSIHKKSHFISEEVCKVIHFEFEPISECIKRVAKQYLREIKSEK